jgi:hypothetical protein
VIDPLPKGEPYPGRLPPLRAQWRRLPQRSQVTIVGIPTLVVVALLATSSALGVVVAVMVAGAGVVSAVYVKNRTDRHNAAVDRGEIRVVPDPHLRPVTRDALSPPTFERLGRLGYQPGQIGQVVRFDGGWIVGTKNRHDVSVVIGDDGGTAYFDPRSVDELRAASEYRAGRGHEPTDS